ncbi:MAG: LysR family transcriptional regulator [Gammaproteobacteria bacterium]|nr:LysR family transcriptional regulator [Gammaproteobacteria bacterium]MBU0788110.1 LysR family transcriptional regulator [Gammaproteobacteria bacterium]MBU0815392.1 LysR family transcriptional regulator [Gammaproteobacteria bacterium]MBU1785500.1 LysR family transcriptional regulator [Gammaproteobacteria bacterium]
MDIRSVDLNLLVVFDAMVEHRSVTRAAEALDLSQPAMSAAVARLRTLFGDPLFVRIGAEMQPTPRAMELGTAIRHVVRTIKSDILQRSAFDPAVSQRTFTLVMPDIAEVNFLPRILAGLAEEAPHTNVRTLAMPRHAAAESLESGSAELALGYFPDLQKAGFYQQKLLRNSHVCLVRKAHPTIRSKMTMAQFLSASHAVVKPDGREHVFEQFLQKKGIKRRVLVEISHFMSLLPIVESSDLVATVPKDLAEFCVRHGDVRYMDTPMKSPVIDVHLFWHRRFQKDPAHAWLRGAIHKLFLARA